MPIGRPKPGGTPFTKLTFTNTRDKHVKFTVKTTKKGTNVQTTSTMQTCPSGQSSEYIPPTPPEDVVQVCVDVYATTVDEGDPQAHLGSVSAYLPVASPQPVASTAECTLSEFVYPPSGTEDAIDCTLGLLDAAGSPQTTGTAVIGPEPTAFQSLQFTDLRDEGIKFSVSAVLGGDISKAAEWMDCPGDGDSVFFTPDPSDPWVNVVSLTVNIFKSTSGSQPPVGIVTAQIYPPNPPGNWGIPVATATCVLSRYDANDPSNNCALQLFGSQGQPDGNGNAHVGSTV